MKIILTEEQYKRIFLSEQDYQWSNTTPKTSATNSYMNSGAYTPPPLPYKKIDFKDKWEQYYKDELEKNQTMGYDPEGALGQTLIMTPGLGRDVVTGSAEGDRQAWARRRKPTAKVHDSTCSSDQKNHCKTKGLVATNVTMKGKEWDIELGNASYDPKTGQYSTMGRGLWDNENYTKCACRRGTVKTTKVQAFDPTVNNYEGGLVTLYNTTFVQSGPSMGPSTQLQIQQRKQYEKMSDWQKQQWDQKQYAKYVAGNRKMQNLSYNPVREFVQEYRHEIIDVLAVATFFIPVVGPFISVGLEGINTAMYFDEGDNVSGTMSGVFMLIPFGGPILRRVTKPVVKNVDNFFKYVKGLEGQPFSESAKKEMIDKSYEKLSKTEKELYNEMMKPENVQKLESFALMGKNGVKQYLKKNKEIYKDILSKETSFGKGSRFWGEFTNPTKLEKIIYATAVGSDIVITPFIYKHFEKKNEIPQDVKEHMSYELQKNLINILEDLKSEEIDNFVDVVSKVYSDSVSTASKLGFDINQMKQSLDLSSGSAQELKKKVDKQNKELKELKNDISIVYPEYNKKAGKLVSTPEGQEEITNNGEDIEYDPSWEYKMYKGVYFTRKKGETEWRFINSPQAISKLDKKAAEEYLSGDGDIETTDQAYQTFLQSLIK